MVDGYIAVGVTLFSFMSAAQPDACRSEDQGGSVPGRPCPTPPGKPPEVTPLAKRHGIALFGARSHHMDLVIAMAEGEFESNEMGKRILAELQIRPGELTKRGEAQLKEEANSGAANLPKDDK